jgi:hypothetical protein
MDASRFRTTDDGRVLLAVSINRNPGGSRNTHAGIVYRDDDGTLFHLHLATHWRLKHEGFEDGTLFVIPDLQAEFVRLVRRMCRRISLRPPRISYALRYPRTARFVVAGRFAALEGEDNGLNCSTFVLTLFDTYGVQVVRFADWPIRVADARWHRKIVDYIRSIDPAQANRLEPEIGCQRVRPEEVAAAFLFPEASFPVSPDDAMPASHWLLPILIPTDCCCL